MATAKKATAKTTVPAKKAAAKAPAKTAPAPAPKEPEKPKGPTLPMVYRDGTHSAIVFEIGAKHVTLITMGSLTLEEMRLAEFESAFEPYPEYPVSRCAEIYLSSGQYRLIDEPTRERLLVLTGGKCPVPQKTFAQQQTKDTEVKNVPHHPLRRASDATLREALKEAAGTKPVAAGKPAATKPTDKPTPAKKVAESKEAKAPVPAKKAAAKTSDKPAAKKAPWDKGDGAKPAAKKAAAKTAPPVRASRFGEDTKVKMGDTGKAKRGKMLVYIEKAIELAKKNKGATTRGAIDSAVAKGWEGDDLNTYFPYAVKNGLLVVA